jgi:hypothetical protein
MKTGSREERMPTTYKEKLIEEIKSIPEEMLPKLYKIIHILKVELMLAPKEKKGRSSLKGIWKGSQIDDSLFIEAKKSLFPYEHKQKT